MFHVNVSHSHTMLMKELGQMTRNMKQIIWMFVYIYMFWNVYGMLDCRFWAQCFGWTSILLLVGRIPSATGEFMCCQFAQEKRDRLNVKCFSSILSISFLWARSNLWNCIGALPGIAEGHPKCPCRCQQSQGHTPRLDLKTATTS